MNLLEQFSMRIDDCRLDERGSDIDAQRVWRLAFYANSFHSRWFRIIRTRASLLGTRSRTGSIAVMSRGEKEMTMEKRAHRHAFPRGGFAVF